MVPTWVITLGLFVLVLGTVYNANILNESVVSGIATIPIVWWHVDDYQVNTREWLSFEDRATHEPNEPYLRICLQKARSAFADLFRIEPLIGRAAVLRRLEAAGCRIPDGAERCPPALWMPWARCAMLAHLGGLWLDGSVLVIANAADIHQRLVHDIVLTFGSDADESLASSAQDDTGPAAGRSAGWAAVSGHPMWVGMARDICDIIQEGAQSWSSFEARRSLRYLWSKHCSGMTRIDRKAEVSRTLYGKRLHYEDLFEKTEWPAGTTKGGLWVPLPDGRDKLEMASAYLWFTRLSEAQIMESEFMWARLAKSI
jgi:hypothetical protein